MAKTHHSDTSRQGLAIFALIAPSVVFIVSLSMLAIINLVFNPTFWMVGDTEPVNPTPLGIAILNGLFATTGTIGFISLLPGVVAGIILLIRKKTELI